MTNSIREDLKIIGDMIESGSSVLDLGCGEGEFLSYLHGKNVKGVGVEINQDKIFESLAKGLNVIHSNLDEGLALFDSNMFDYVILNETLQVLHKPINLLQEMLRVGKTCIVGISNFGHWKIRMYLGLIGKMPMSETLPYEWYDTPNIHLCTLKDFEISCKKNGIKILNKYFFKRPISAVGTSMGETESAELTGLFRNWSNYFAVYGIYQIKKDN